MQKENDIWRPVGRKKSCEREVMVCQTVDNSLREHNSQRAPERLLLLDEYGEDAV